ncbi:MAG TPA: TRZ/ATZ family hydrolase [Verrucomicrobiae bacterium]|nr:TRZ/ATZ family hydrolase [Verrucomicrobiae bacterium]
MQNADLLVLPRWIVPVEPAAVVLEEHALVVRDGRIVDLLPADFARQAYSARETLELPQHVVMPGLVNIHTHAAMSLLRGLADDLPLMDWLQGHIWPAEGAHVSRQFCEDGVALACAEFIRGGITCFNDMYMFPDATAAVASAHGLRASVGLIVLDFPTAWAQPGEYLHKGLELHDKLKGDPLVRTVFAPHAPYTVSDGPLREVRKYATELSIPIHMHVHETAGEVEMAVNQTGKRPWQRLKELGLVGPDLIAVHMTQLTDAEVSDCAEHGVSIAHCPESNLKLASGFCPVDKLLKAGVNVALGTDGAASNNDLDLLGEMRTAALLAKGVSGDARAVAGHEALHMATLAGAKAIGLDAEIGSLAKGKAADFIAVDLGEVATQPLYNVISQIVYASSRHNVTDVFVAGRGLLRNRAFTGVDEPAVIARAQEWRQKIRP